MRPHVGRNIARLLGTRRCLPMSERKHYLVVETIEEDVEKIHAQKRIQGGVKIVT